MANRIGKQPRRYISKRAQVCPYDSTTTGRVHMVDVNRAIRFARKNLPTYSFYPDLAEAQSYIERGLVDLSRVEPTDSWFDRPILFVIEQGRVKIVDGKHRFCFSALSQLIAPLEVTMQQIPYEMIEQVCIAHTIERRLGVDNAGLRRHLESCGGLA